MKYKNIYDGQLVVHPLIGQGRIVFECGEIKDLPFEIDEKKYFNLKRIEEEKLEVKDDSLNVIKTNKTRRK